MQKFRYLYTCIFGALIAVASLVDLSNTAGKVQTFDGFDKVVHGVMYFILSGLFIWEYRGRRHLMPKGEDTIYDATDRLYRIFWCVLLICIIYGGSIEYIQGLTAYRSKDMADLTADVMGGLFAYLVYYLLTMTHSNHIEDK